MDAGEVHTAVLPLADHTGEMEAEFVLIDTNRSSADGAATWGDAVHAGDNIAELENDRVIVVRSAAAAFNSVSASKIDIERFVRTVRHARAGRGERERRNGNVAARQWISISAATP